MQKSKDEAARIKAALADVSSSLVTSVSETVRELEQERNKLFEQKGRLNDKLDKHNHELERYSKRLKEAKKELEGASGNQKQIKELMAKGMVLDKFKDAIKRIGELNQSLSLVSINEYLSRAYTLLSEDTGRRIYLCQFKGKEQYSLLTYLQSRYSDIYSRWTNSGRIMALADDGLSDKEIHEQVVLQVAEGKSTGQSKINSLAFAKAVLEYSNEDRSTDNLKVSHDYPFLIDSPFTELSDDNLKNVAKYINTFAGQVIIMADDTSYAGVEQFMKSFVNTKTQLIKDKEKGISYVKK